MRTHVFIQAEKILSHYIINHFLSLVFSSSSFGEAVQRLQPARKDATTSWNSCHPLTTSTSKLKWGVKCHFCAEVGLRFPAARAPAPVLQIPHGVNCLSFSCCPLFSLYASPSVSVICDYSTVCSKINYEIKIISVYFKSTCICWMNRRICPSTHSLYQKDLYPNF